MRKCQNFHKQSSFNHLVWAPWWSNLYLNHMRKHLTFILTEKLLRIGMAVFIYLQLLKFVSVKMFYSGIGSLACLYLNRETQKPGDNCLRQALGPGSTVLLVLGFSQKPWAFYNGQVFSFFFHSYSSPLAALSWSHRAGGGGGLWCCPRPHQSAPEWACICPLMHSLLPRAVVVLWL